MGLISNGPVAQEAIEGFRGDNNNSTGPPMTSHETDATNISLALELLASNGFDRIADALQILMNEAMLIERSEPTRGTTL